MAGSEQARVRNVAIVFHRIFWSVLRRLTWPIYFARYVVQICSAATVSIGCCLCALPLCWMLGIHDQWEISPPREQTVDGAARRHLTRQPPRMDARLQRRRRHDIDSQGNNMPPQGPKLARPHRRPLVLLSLLGSSHDLVGRKLSM